MNMSLHILLISMALIIATVNVRSVVSKVRCKAVLECLEGIDADVFFLQECGIGFKKEYRELESMWVKGESVWSGTDENKNAGVAILFKNNKCIIKEKSVLQDGRVVMVRVVCNKQEIKLVNVYAPVEKHQRLEVLGLVRMELSSSMPVVMGGDWNCVRSGGDKKDGKENFKLDKTSVLLNKIIKDFKLVDCYKMIHPGGGFTWSNSQGTSKSRIDMIFVSEGVKCQDCKLEPMFFSDHVMVRATLDLGGVSEKGKGVWKLNVKLLEDSKIREKYVEKYKGWRSLQVLFEKKSEWWDFVKRRTKLFFINEGRDKVRKAKEKCKWLEKKLQRLFLQERAGFEVSEEIKGVKERIKQFMYKKSETVMLQSKIERIEKEETCSRFFFKKVFDRKQVMEGLKGEDGVVRNGNKGMCEVAESFYENLYNEKSVVESNCKEMIEGINVFLSNEQKVGLEKGFSLEELDNALKASKMGKTPGEDGLPSEYYKCFWDVLKYDLLSVFIESSNAGEMATSFKRSVITLLYKKGDREDLKNWRPISLLNTDYKLLAKILTGRMGRVIDTVIHQDQVCAVPGRRIMDSLILVRDSICYARERELPFSILNLDLEKAYDRIAHKYMFGVLLKMGFPIGFVNWIKVLYEDIQSVILVNGSTSKPVKIRSGVRQGCPLSPLLFICCIEPLAIAIRANKQTCGLFVPGSGGEQVKCILYMDDVSIICRDEFSMEKTVGTVEGFCKASGSKVNMGKSECMMYGKWARVPSIGLCLKNDFIQILGVKFYKHGSGGQNWDNVTAKVAQKLGLWSLRELTFEGKCLILKSVILPVLVYLSAVFPPTRNVLCALTRSVMRFFWGRKNEMLKREVVYKAAKNGGKGVPDLTKTLLLHFVIVHVRLCLYGSSKTAHFVKYFLGPILRGFKMFYPVLTVPTSWEAPFLYNKIKLFLKKEELFVLEKEVWQDPRKVRKFVQDREKMCNVSFFNPQVVEGIWLEVAHPRLMNRHKDLAWQTVHEILPVRASMYRRNLWKTPRCPFKDCGAEETAAHLFWGCGQAKKVWREAEDILSGFLNNRNILKAMVLHGVKPGFVVKEKWACLWILLNCFKEAMWKARNLFVFKGKLLTSEEVKILACYRLREYQVRDALREGEEIARERWSTCWSLPATWTCAGSWSYDRG